jgi:hypothetical protein
MKAVRIHSFGGPLDLEREIELAEAPQNWHGPMDEVDLDALDDSDAVLRRS